MDIEIRDKTNADAFCSIFQHVRLFSDHINITFNETQLYVQSMDSSHIVIFEIHLPKTWFDVYTRKEGSGDTTIGISADIFSKVLHTRDKTQLIRLEVSTEISDKLTVHFTGNDEITTLDKHFSLPLMDIESEMLSIPDFDSDVSITMPSANLASIINQLQIFGDTIEFHCSKEKIQMTSDSSVVGKMEVDIVNSSQTSYTVKDDVAMKVSFALYRMRDICSNSKLTKDVEIVLTDCYPIRVTYNVGNGGKMVFYLAPKIDDSR